MLPDKKTSHSAKNKRRSHLAKNPANYSECPRCNSPRLPHAACDNCGYVRKGLSLEVKKEA